jgi:hypothetical protein
LNLEEIGRMLDDFIEGHDRSMALAGRLEVAIDEAFPDDNECQDLVLALASYRPGGGDQLYDEKAIATKCARIKSRIGAA